MFGLFFKSLVNRWFEYILAAVVVAVVIAALTTQRALSSSTENQVHDLAHKLGKNMLVVPKATDLSDFYAMQYGNAAMPDSYPQRIQDSELRQHISLVQSRLYGNIEPSRVPLVLVGEQTISRGSVLQTFSSNRVTLSAAASSKLGAKTSDTVQVNGVPLQVERINPTPPDGLDVGIFGPLDLVQNTLKKPGEINAMRLAGCWCRVDVPVLASQVEGLLPNTKALTVAGMIKAQKGTVATAKKYSTVSFTVAAFLIGAIVLVLIASQVKRQVREIGLLLATGASPWFIVLLFMTKAGMVGILGGLGGYLLGFPLTDKVASRLIGLPLPVPDGLLGISIAVAVVVSMVAALVPATLAARLDPTVVLREVG